VARHLSAAKKNFQKRISFFDYFYAGMLRHQGCQMVYFQTKNSNLGNFDGFRMENVDIFRGRKRLLF
jgi:hypothetical protein